MEQEEPLESLLGEAPSLLPSLTLSLAQAEGPQASKCHPTVAPAAPAATSVAPAAPAAPVQTTVSSSNQTKGIKVKKNDRLVTETQTVMFFIVFDKLFLSFLVCLFLFLQIKEENIIPQIKLEPHEVDQFLNFSPKGQKTAGLSSC